MTAVRWVRSERVLWRRTARGVVALGSIAPEPVVITGSGVLLWELLEEPWEPVELSDALGEAHDMPPQTVLAEITPVIEELVRLGVVELCA
jgi:hypothetical protein